MQLAKNLSEIQKWLQKQISISAVFLLFSATKLLTNEDFYNIT